MSVLNKKLLRALRRNWGQALAVSMVILCGTATYISMASAYHNLRLTRDTYYQQYRFPDFFVSVERAPASAVLRLETIPGVRSIRGRVTDEATIDVPGSDDPRLGRLVSMPDRRVPVLNDIHMVSGRYFDEGAPNQTIVNTDFAEANDLEIGGTISVTIDGRRHTLRIIGTAMSPEFVYMIPSAESLYPNPERFGVFWVPESFVEMAMDMRGAWNDIIGTVDDPRNLRRVLDRMETELDGYGVFATIKAEDQISNSLLSDEIQSLEAIVLVLPTIFMGIAAAILLVLLNRMVRQERTEIGLLKAYGYSNLHVSGYYVRYALILGGAGALGGIAVGLWLARGLGRIYVDFFQFPVFVMQVYPGILANAILLSLAFALLGALSAARNAAAIQPAESMRPEAPRHAHRTLVERFDLLWRNLSFTWKMIFRNVSRYRLRAALNAGGVMIATGLLLIGLVFIDSVYYMIDFQFREAQREDMRINFVREMPRSALHSVARYEGVRRAEPMLQYPFEFTHGWRSQNNAIFGLAPDSQLRRLLDTEARPVPIEGRGVILSDKLARDLGVSAGSTVTIRPLKGRTEKEYEVTVRQVVQEYLGITAYMELDELSRLLGGGFAMNVALLRADPDAIPAIARAMTDTPAVASADIAEENYENIADTIAENIAVTSTLLVIFAGVIAFSIIYNSTVVSLLERERELASLRVLGFTKQEVGAIVYQENFLLGGVGVLLGLPFGAWSARTLLALLDTDMYRMPYHAETASFMLSAGLIAAFVALANLAVRRRIHRLDMVEVLKSRE